MLNLTSLVRNLTARATHFVDRLLGYQPQQANPVPPVSDSTAHAAESETIAASVVPEGRESEPIKVPVLTTDTTIQNSESSPTDPVELPTPTVEPIAVRERPTTQCRNYRHPQTGRQCTNRVRLDNMSGLCEECVHSCAGNCGREIACWYEYCKPCRYQCCNRMHWDTRRQCQNRVSFPDQLCQECLHPCWGDCGRQVYKWHTHCNSCRSGGRIRRCQCGVLIPWSHEHCTLCRSEIAKPMRPQPRNQTKRPGTGWLQPENPPPRHKCGREGCYRMIPARYPYCETHRRP